MFVGVIIGVLGLYMTITMVGSTIRDPLIVAGIVIFFAGLIITRPHVSTRANYSNLH